MTTGHGTFVGRLFLFPQVLVILLSSLVLPESRAQNTEILLQGLTREVYTNVPGNTVAELIQSPKFPTYPDIVTYVDSFATPSQSGDNYGERLTGFLLPPLTGDYVFYVCSDDQAVLLLSTDSTPGNAVQIASEATWCFPGMWIGPNGGRTNSANVSLPVHLEAGKRYYIEALHKEGVGGDNFGVTWQLPGAQEPQNGDAPIMGEFLARLGASNTNQLPQIGILSPTNQTVLSEGTNLILSAWARDEDGPFLIVELFSDGQLLGEAFNVMDSRDDVFLMVWTNVPAGLHTLVAKATDGQGAAALSAPVQIVVTTKIGFVTRRFERFSVQLVAAPSENVRAYAVADQPPANWTVTSLSADGIVDPLSGTVKFGPYFDHSPRTFSYQVQPPPGARGSYRFVGEASADGVSGPITGEALLVIPDFHPADMHPADWRVDIDEVTAYAAAWRSGETWALPPSPIQMDYVTRAGALWRGGETYTVDPAVASPPMCWVNALLHTQDFETLDADKLSVAMRQVSPAFVPGEPLEIVIDTRPGSKTWAYAVEESIPIGAEISQVNYAGQLDKKTRSLKWGPFYDTSPRKLRYCAMFPGAHEAIVHFAGKLSFDGRGALISGKNESRSGSRLEWLAQGANGQGKLLLHGSVGAVYTLEASTNLATWVSVQTITNRVGDEELNIFVPSGSVQRYYRACLIH